MIQTWVGTLITGQVDGSPLTNTTPTSIIPAAAKFTIPPNTFQIGMAIRALVHGRISNVNPTPGNFQFDFKLGSVIAGGSGTVSLNTAQASTNVSFTAEFFATCRAIGASTSANLMFQWRLTSAAFSLLATAACVPIFAPATAPAVGTGFDSTTTQVVDIFGTWSVNNAANTITVHQYWLELLN